MKSRPVRYLPTFSSAPKDVAVTRGAGTCRWVRLREAGGSLAGPAAAAAFAEPSAGRGLTGSRAVLWHLVDIFILLSVLVFLSGFNRSSE